MQTAAPASSLAWIIPVGQVALIGGVFYFLLLRPGNLARKQAAEMIGGLKKNDDIVTSGGVVGRVKEIKENLVTIESGTSTLVVERSMIVRINDKATSGRA